MFRIVSKWVEIPDWSWFVRHTTNLLKQTWLQTHFKWCVLGQKFDTVDDRFKPVCHCLLFWFTLWRMAIWFPRFFFFRLDGFLHDAMMVNLESYTQSWAFQQEGCEPDTSLGQQIEGILYISQKRSIGKSRGGAWVAECFPNGQQ